jgi:hypothetical protein
MSTPIHWPLYFLHGLGACGYQLLRVAWVLLVWPAVESAGTFAHNTLK